MSIFLIPTSNMITVTWIYTYAIYSFIFILFFVVLGAFEGGDESRTWWRHQMETFLCYWPFVRGIHRSPVNSPTKASDADVWISFDLHLNKRLSKQSRGRWFETPSCSLWRHRNGCYELAKWKVILLLSSMSVHFSTLWWRHITSINYGPLKCLPTLTI